MIFLFRTAFWFSLVLAFVPPNFKIKPDHAFYEMALNILPDHLAQAVETPAEPPEPVSVCVERPGLCNVSEELGLLLDVAGEQAQRRLPELVASDNS